MSIKYLYDRKKIAVTYGEEKYSYADIIKYVNYYFAREIYWLICKNEIKIRKIALSVFI